MNTYTWRWMEYLNSASEVKYNVAHVNSMDELNKNQVAQYVERCIEIAKQDCLDLRASAAFEAIIMRTLQWMDVAKCGSSQVREEWKKALPHICLDVHNEASAAIYEKYCDQGDMLAMKNVVHDLIYTHGLIGQYLMGEVGIRPNEILHERAFGIVYRWDESFRDVLRVLNHAIIAGVSKELWEQIKDDVYAVIERIIRSDFREDDTLRRLKKLFPAYKNVDELTEKEAELFEYVFSHVDLWYPAIALQNFSRKEIVTIFDAMSNKGLENINHISFYDFSKELSYDRNGKRKTNIYKQRVVEVLLRELSDHNSNICEKEHVKISCEVDGDCLKFMVRFTPVCEALINFCVEAERSGFATYQKNIITLFEMFGFRRDIFDRLSNEEAYLETMNNAQHSTKLNTLSFVQGDVICDVGSGGGVLLDEMEKRFPDKQIVGTDISANVIEVLNKKIRDEGHRYSVMKHNFVDSRLPEMPVDVDTIIFSSIMHEIYSYTEFEGNKFNINSVKKALRNAADSLAPGGRIIIRDGVMTDSDRVVSVHFKDEDALVLAKNYLKDFQGLTHLRDESGNWKDLKIDSNIVTANINLIREMLYTITWGPMSYPMEVQEQFGYFRLNEFREALECLGMRIAEANEFTESGYPEHLSDKVELIDFDWAHIPSNCIIVADKLC